jgi:hypothetical protein
MGASKKCPGCGRALTKDNPLSKLPQPHCLGCARDTAEAFGKLTPDLKPIPDYDRFSVSLANGSLKLCGLLISIKPSRKGNAIMANKCYLSPFFITDPEGMEVVFENAYILIHERKISSKRELLPLLEQITKIGKPLLIIAEDVDGEALATLVGFGRAGGEIPIVRF